MIARERSHELSRKADSLAACYHYKNFIARLHRKAGAILMSKSTQKPELLPVNVLYFAWLRDYGKYNRPRAYRETIIKHKDRPDEIKIYTKTEMDMIDYSIYVNLLTRANKTTLTCFPSVNLIGADCFGLERRTVFNHLSDLEQMGFIETKKQKGKANTYYLKDFAEWLKNPRCNDEVVTTDDTSLQESSDYRRNYTSVVGSYSN